jgi:hypothetical protein
MRQFASFLFACAFIFIGAKASHAALITFAFSGTVYSVSFNNGTPTEFGVGDTFSGTFTFNSNAIDSAPNVDSGTYIGAVVSTSLNVDSYNASGNGPGDILISNLATDDTYRVGVSNLAGSTVLGLDLRSFNLSLNGPASILTSDALPLTPPNPAAFTYAKSLNLTFFNDARTVFGSVYASVDSFTLVSVPEPSSLLMAGMGILIIGRRRRR